MKFPFLNKFMRTPTPTPAPAPATPSTSAPIQDGAREALRATKRFSAKTQSNKQLINQLRTGLSYYSKHLPDVIRIPARGATRPEEVLRSLADATVDDLAFAIQASEAEHSAVIRRTGALKELHEAARLRGALGSSTIAQVFAADDTQEASK